ncbi:ABC transporter substrate-binding protein [Clostridium oceanicum]|uniref:Bacterial extracellular solute-binding protein n=1 Tax=Clostridium oceanicum TaxID=1543 RepID=A0ABN1JFX9_9CLOT
MKVRIKQIIALIICLVMLFSITACTSSKDKKDKKDKNKIGRYLEDKMKIPNNRSINRMRVLEDGKIEIIASDSKRNKYILLSEDKGKTWTENKINISLKGKDVFFVDGDIFKNGDAIISYSISNDESGGIAKDVKYEYIMVDSQGKKKDTNLDFIDKYTTKSDKKVPVKKFQNSESGDLFLSVENEVIQLDGDTKKEKRKFTSDDLVEDYALVDNSIIIWSHDNPIKYNIKTGKKEDLSKLTDNLKEFKGNSKTTLVGNSKNKLYYSNSTGLYCYDTSSLKSSKLVEGNLSRFGSDSKNVVGFSQNKDEEFIVAFMGESGGLFNYTYSKNTKATPDNKIKVYLLNSSFNIKKAVAEYASSNPDANVEIEYGITDENTGATLDDVIKKLNTEILAGKGPDVIFLDGLPIDSYIKQGILEDMSDVISKYTSEGKVFKGLKDASEVHGKIYSYPLSIEVPIMIGEKNDINKMTDLKSFTNTIKDLGSKSDKRIIDRELTPLELISKMYYAYGYDWLNEDKSINKEKLKDFMTKAKDIYKINNEKYGKYVAENNIPSERTNSEKINKKSEPLNKILNEVKIDEELSQSIYPNSLYTEKEPSQLEIGTISQGESFSEIVTSKMNNKKLDYKILSRNNKNMIIPIDQIGINAKSGDKEIAKDFVKYLLSENVQNNIRMSFPVNKKSFDNNIRKIPAYPNYTPYLDKTNNRTVTGEAPKKDGSKYKIYWQNEDDIKKLKDEIGKVKILPKADIMFLNGVIKEFESYVTDKIDVDKAIKNVIDNLELYLTE